MQVNISVDEQDVQGHLANHTSAEFDPLSGYVEGELTDIVAAVIANLSFEFDRDDAELGTVLQFPSAR